MIRAMKNTGTLKLTMPSEREIAMMRVFDAPREWIFESWSKPDLLKRWLYGPEEYPLAVCEIELRVGGAFRFVFGATAMKKNRAWAVA